MRSLRAYSFLMILIFIILCVISYFYLDQRLAYFVHDHINKQGYLYRTAQCMGYLGGENWWMFIVSFGFILTAMLYAGSPSKIIYKKLCYLFVSIAIAMVVAGGLQFFIGRYRPELLFQSHLYGFHVFAHQASLHSMPSAYVVQIFAAATALTVICRRSAILVFSIAIAVAVSRLVLNVHFLSDILLAVLIGTLVSLWVKALLFK